MTQFQNKMAAVSGTVGTSLIAFAIALGTSGLIFAVTLS